jgi:D-alanyl-D-alanine carboxypeptidase
VWYRLIGAVLLGVVAGCGDSTDPAASPATAPAPPPSSSPVDTSTTDPPATGEIVDAGEIERVLAAKRDRYPAPGALAVVAVGDERVGGWSGAADLDGTPITPDTRFRIASITKAITATLVLDAVQRGELSLDDRVDDLVPGLLTEEPPVTVRMLLEHSAGIYDQTNSPDILADIALLTDPDQIAQADDLLNRYLAGEDVLVPDTLLVAAAEAHGRDFPAGTEFGYGNVNYQVAAIVLETVTARPIAELLQERIVEPLGLEHTTIAPPDLASPEFRGYGTDIDDGSLVDITDELTFIGNGASGGIISTADELVTIMLAIVGGHLLDAALLDDMRTPTELSDGTYGLGLARYGLTCGTFYGHEGGVNGTASIALVSEDGANAVVASVNLRDGTNPELPALADDLLCPTLQPARSTTP